MTSSIDATSDVSSRIVDALYFSDPELDTSIGTPLRKVIDSVADQIAQTSLDAYLTDYQYDIDSKVGGDLDDFCANFGIARLVGTRSTGVVTFSRSASLANTYAVNIPTGTQITTTTIPQQNFQTTVTTLMDIGVQSVDVPVQALNAGPDGNITANTPLLLSSTVNGVSTLSNALAFIGGSIDETDDQLRARFKATVFRNLAGTDAMYRGIALQTLANFNAGSFGVGQVNIIGTAVHTAEQIQVSGGTATSSLTTAACVFPQSIMLSDGASVNYTNGVHYTYTVNNNSIPATLSIAAISTNLPDGVYSLEYDYVPIASRNDPFNLRFNQGIVSNRVDVIVNGQNSTNAVQPVAYVPTTAFNSSAGDPLYWQRFADPAGNRPSPGDVFIPLAFGPILTIPTTLVFSGSANVYAQGTNYDIVHQDDSFGYTPSSLFGIWWKVGSVPSPPATDATCTIGVAPTDSSPIPVENAYTYNSVPASVQTNLASWRMVGTDVQVHAGKPAYLTLNFAIVYDRSVNIDTVNTNVETAMDTFLKGLGFNAAVQTSDLIQVAHNVTGVDNIRLTSNTDDPVNYAIQQVTTNGTLAMTYAVNGRPTDVYFDERTYPLLYSINFSPRARNTFRT